MTLKAGVHLACLLPRLRAGRKGLVLQAVFTILTLDRLMAVPKQVLTTVTARAVLGISTTTGMLVGVRLQLIQHLRFTTVQMPNSGR